MMNRINSQLRLKLTKFGRVLEATAPVALLALFAASSFAATPSNESLKGSYAFQLSTPKLAFWSNSKSCKQDGNTITYYASNWATYSELVYGVATFDGAGHVSLTFTKEGEVNQDASNATIEITCTAQGFTNTGGSIVYEPAQNGTGSGSYTVESTGSGSMTFSVAGQSGSMTINFELAGFATNGVASTALLNFEEGQSDKRIGTGTAVLK